MFDTSHRLSIIVPYRDRQAHLQQFVAHMLAYFERDKVDKSIDYRVTIVEQGNDGLFNAGLMLTKDDFDYFCFHDVDYLPVWADYSFPEGPTCALWYGAEKRPIDRSRERVIIHDYNELFGGVVLFRKEQFELVNGFSVRYWG